jgi:hypothetical protein
MLEVVRVDGQKGIASVSGMGGHSDFVAGPPAPGGGGRGELTCRDVIALLLDYLDRALGPDVLAELERHLADCEPCRAYLRTYARSRQLVGEASRVEMPADLEIRLRQFLLDRLRGDRA